jgi:hypothetical protein
VVIGPTGDREATVEMVERRGADAVVHLRLVEPAAEVMAVVAGEPPREGDQVFLTFPPDRLHQFDAGGVLKK